MRTFLAAAGLAVSSALVTIEGQADETAPRFECAVDFFSDFASTSICEYEGMRLNPWENDEGINQTTEAKSTYDRWYDSGEELGSYKMGYFNSMYTYLYDGADWDNEDAESTYSTYDGIQCLTSLYPVDPVTYEQIFQTCENTSVGEFCAGPKKFVTSTGYYYWQYGEFQRQEIYTAAASQYLYPGSYAYDAVCVDKNGNGDFSKFGTDWLIVTGTYEAVSCDFSDIFIEDYWGSIELTISTSTCNVDATHAEDVSYIDVYASLTGDDGSVLSTYTESEYLWEDSSSSAYFYFSYGDCDVVYTLNEIVISDDGYSYTVYDDTVTGYDGSSISMECSSASSVSVSDGSVVDTLADAAFEYSFVDCSSGAAISDIDTSGDIDDNSETQFCVDVSITAPNAEYYSNYVFVVFGYSDADGNPSMELEAGDVLMAADPIFGAGYATNVFYESHIWSDDGDSEDTMSFVTSYVEALRVPAYSGDLYVNIFGVCLGDWNTGEEVCDMYDGSTDSVEFQATYLGNIAGSIEGRRDYGDSAASVSALAAVVVAFLAMF